METEKNVFVQLELSRKRCFFALALAFFCFYPQSLGSETLTLTTYYPAPYGGYVSLLTTGGNASTPVNTLLARDAGYVGIGTAIPTQLLDVAGNIKVETVILTSLAHEPAKAEAVDGMMYVDSAGGNIHRYWKGSWDRLLIAKDELVGERILENDVWLTHGQIGDLRITEKTPQRGFYSISWGGTVRVNADDKKKALIEIRYGESALIESYELYDDDGYMNSGFTDHDIGGSTLLQLNKNRNYRIRINGSSTGSEKQNTSIAVRGLWIRLELVFIV